MNPGRGAAGAVLYVVTCGAPPARHVGELVELAGADGYDVCVVATPSARKWLDVAGLERRTGHPVRSDYKRPEEPDVLPPPDALLVAPATSNTVNKWAAGITDTLALGLVVESTGAGLPVVAMPSTSPGLAAFPAFGNSLRALRECGVSVLFGPDGAPPEGADLGSVAAAAAGADGHGFPWRRGLDAVTARLGR